MKRKTLRKRASKYRKTRNKNMSKPRNMRKTKNNTKTKNMRKKKTRINKKHYSRKMRGGIISHDLGIYETRNGKYIKYLLDIVRNIVTLHWSFIDNYNEYNKIVKIYNFETKHLNGAFYNHIITHHKGVISKSLQENIYKILGEMPVAKPFVVSNTLSRDANEEVEELYGPFNPVKPQEGSSSIGGKLLKTNSKKSKKTKKSKRRKHRNRRR